MSADSLEMRIKASATLTLVLALTGCAAQGSTCPEGWSLIEARDYKGALARFDQALETTESAEFHAGRARALHLMGRQYEAESAYHLARKLGNQK